MADVLAFPGGPQNPMVWRCNCGCISFELRADGDAICCQCETPVVGLDGEWREKLPMPPVQPEPLDDMDVTITDLVSSGAALRRTLGKANEDSTALVIVIQQDGGITTWGKDLDGQHELDWFDRRIATAKQMLTKG